MRVDGGHIYTNACRLNAPVAINDFILFRHTDCNALYLV